MGDDFSNRQCYAGSALQPTHSSLLPPTMCHGSEIEGYTEEELPLKDLMEAKMFTRFAVVIALLLWPSSSICPDAGRGQGGATVRGKVFETGYGTTVEDAKVLFESTTGQMSAASDTDGRYSIEGVPAGNYRVTINCPGFATYRSQVTVGPGRNDLNFPIDVGLQGYSGANLEGVVTDQQGKPIEGAAVVASSPFDTRFTERASTLPDGRYSIVVPRHGQYVVYASKEGHTAIARVVLADSEKTEAGFALPVFHF